MKKKPVIAKKFTGYKKKTFSLKNLKNILFHQKNTSRESSDSSSSSPHVITGISVSATNVEVYGKKIDNDTMILFILNVFSMSKHDVVSSLFMNKLMFRRTSTCSRPWKGQVGSSPPY